MITAERDPMIERWKLLAVFAATNLAYLLYDALRFHPPPPGLLAGRAGIELSLVAALVVLRRPHPPGWDSTPTLRWACTGALLSWFLVVEGAGGIESAYFAMLPAFPLLYVAGFPEDPVGAVLLGTIDLVGGLLLLRAHGAGAGPQVEWASVSLFLAAAAFIGGVLARRRAVRELLVEKARREAVEQLARSEERRLVSERLALVGRLAAGVAHEINNPLSYLRSSLAWLERSAHLEADQEAREAIEDALAGVTHIAEIVSDLGTFARGAPDALEVCPPAEVVGEALRLASFRTHRVGRVVQEIDPSLPSLLVPRRRLVQALVNLLLNAADALEGRSAASPDGSWIRLAVQRRQEQVELVVEDNGPGIDPRVQAHLFEPFVTTKGPGGTGLGLAVSREHVERCGGTLEAESRPGGGARFTIRVPLERPEAAPGDPADR